MQVKIQIIATSIETKQGPKSSYQMLDITYRDLDKNKVASKKVMSFNKPEIVFKTMATAKPTDVFDVELIKNEGTGYWDWTNVTKTSATDAPSTSPTSATKTSSAGSSKSGGWETPEERAKKQIYIVRQSSLSNAVNALSVNAKTAPKAEDVIEYARTLEKFVFEFDSAQTVARKDVQQLDGFEDDLDIPL
jgi:hypothetical protein